MSVTYVEAVGQGVRLGKKPAQRLATNFPLTRYVKSSVLLPAAPTYTHYGQVVTQQHGVYPMYDNDKLGDCTTAAAGHMEQVWSYVAGSPETPPLKAVDALYWATGTQDDGRYLDQVLVEWRKGAGLDGEQILGYASVNVKDRAAVCAALWLFGGLYIGIGLPVTAQRQTTWHVDAAAPAADRAPYSWGGHCVNASGYSTSGVWFATWGKLMRMTWGFWNAYVDEAFAIINPDWLTNGKSPKVAGAFDQPALEADLAKLP